MATGIVPSFGRPGIGSAVTAQRSNVSRDGALGFFPGGGTIEGTRARDPGHSAVSTFSLRPGLLMGKITTGGFYANSILGISQNAYTSGGTTITVSVASALEIVRRVGTSGNLKFTGPPSAAGTVATITQAFSAVNTSTGAITITSLGANMIAGAFVQPTDGSETPVTFIPDGHNLVVPDDSSDIPFPWIPVSGIVDVANLIDWPSDSSLKTWVRAALSTAAGGKFVFSDQY